MQLIWIGAAALAGGLVGVAIVYFPMSRSHALLRERVERSEQARNGAIERSAQAREQIAQLNKAIADLRESHSRLGLVKTSTSASSVEERRAAAEKALAQARSDEKTLVLPKRTPLQAFPDTEVLDGKG